MTKLLDRALGLEELGAMLSCNRDGALMNGVEFRRAQTIMSGGPHCDFAYRPRAAAW